MKNLGNYILKKARIAGICEPWADLVGTTDSVGELLKLYVKGIDFCLEKNFPSNADLMRLGGKVLEKYGIHVDKEVSGIGADFTVLLGTCKAKLQYGSFSAAQLFVKHSSVANVFAYDNAFVMIDCFDNAVVNVTAYGNSKVVVNVYKYAQITQKASDNAIIKVVHKNKSSY